jgi:hypothetical protein
MLVMMFHTLAARSVKSIATAFVTDEQAAA